MDDRTFLERQTRMTRGRLHRNAAALHEDLERMLAPSVREHPRKSLAAGALSGLVAGCLLAPAPARRRPDSRRGPVATAWAFVTGTGVHVLRTCLADMLIPDGTEGPE